METCLGGRRNKQKQQQPQSHHPSHHLQQQFSAQPHHHHQQQQQQQQFHPHHHYHNQQQQQQQQTQHFHQKSSQQEKYNPAADFIMHPGFCASSTGSNIRHNNYSPGSHEPPFPHFPPPPDYPPPGMTSLTMKQVNPIAGTTVTPTTSGIGLCSGITSGDSGEGSLSSSGGGTRRKVHRYPDDLDSIEVCLEQEPISMKSFRNINTTTATASGNVGMSNSNSNHGNNLAESHVKWSRSNTSAKVDKFSQPITSPTASGTTANEIIQHMHQDYSYAYYEPGAAMRHSNIPPPEQTAGPSRPPPPNSIRALLSKGKKNKLLVSQSTRQSYQTRYGSGSVAGGGIVGGIKQENFYEEIGSDGRNAKIASMMHPAGSINQTMVEEELRRVQNRHRKILGELNLSVEAMLMPETPSSGSPTEEEPTTTTTTMAANSRSSNNLDELINTVGPTDELLSPVSSTTNPGFCGDLDSGFSGSSGASYIGSLRYHKTNAALSNLINTRNNKCAPSDNVNNSGSNNSGGISSGGISSGAIGSFYNNSCRSSQRSHDESDTHGLLSRSSHGNTSKTLRFIDKSKSVDESSSSTATVAPAVTESKARSFWNRKGWKNFPGFSSTSSINQTGVGKFYII